ncbi:hypothetical protein CEUSTIGMA_g3708.t1 [Chlamydomonas eustigma]|uniref:Protein HGH1 homolog n=1 Tax=Chlamydomonas eustigma TaxID=1157962 RepID=A0A250WZJ0_9CHLO|nr:hypothetical protein CEUSTIGMA_g3708.t1 [Chlamydomonas eustigma]|eukprot:GAX76264.1 hypothetical protein CEUSTIGMA_g3708.t1 [Chlamydomonas eustigma]
MSELDELIDFLADKRPHILLAALDIIKGLSGSPDGINQLKSRIEKLLVFLLRLVPVPDPDSDKIKASESSLTCLVNLAQEPEVVIHMLEKRVIGRLMDYLRDGLCPHHRLMAMLISNLSMSDEGCKDLLQLGLEKLEGLNMAVLLKRFVVSGVDFVEGRPDPFEHLAGVLVNVTRMPKGRQLLLQPGRGLLQALVSQLQSPNEIRRRGCAGALQNCCMQAEEDGCLTNLLQDEMVLARMLKPINGEEPKEKDTIVRQSMSRALLALASTQLGRDALWKIKAPDILKKGYEDEQDPEVCLAMEQAAELFIFNSQVNDVGSGENLSAGAGQN